MTDQQWTAVPLVAVDLEGTGSQDRDGEQILEIAAVPLEGGGPDMGAAWDTVLNPGRWISPRPWISPGLAGDALAAAPALADVRGQIAARLDGRVLVGHNIGVDWRLLHRRLPELAPAGLLDTARLVRHLRPGIRRWNLAGALAQYGLEERVRALVPGGRPHRALWDAVAVAVLLPVLVACLPGGGATTAAVLRGIAGVPLGSEQPDVEAEQLTFDV
ncbi:3'-5' exonuclease [Nonomuraea sp. NPDC023979]|uniref:3'-5' exonuclease n=1 Tax=Nonomuraea sp. NPDC023979 TaxID=3154796 RepID=UPI003404D5EA